MGGVRVNDVSPRDRDIAMVFQNYALYPHMTVRDNIGFGSASGVCRRLSAARRVNETAEHARPHATSCNASRASSRADSASASRWDARSSAARRPS